MEMFDYLIVGTGLFGSVFAFEATKRGKRCLVIEKRNHVGGNVYCESVNGINVHKYGAHIFHTNDKVIWDYVNSLVEFNRYTNSLIAVYKGKVYNLPFNMNTFYQLWKVKSPDEAKARIHRQIKKPDFNPPKNLEEQALSLVGKDIYEKLIKGYTEKQWGRSCKKLPAFIIKRLPVRFTYDNNYFNDKYQGIPIDGYTKLVEKLLIGSAVRLNCDFFDQRNELEKVANKIVFTGQIDQFFDFKLGYLEYRSLRFEHEELSIDNYQGCAVVNYTEKKIPYTRIIEHKHFVYGNQPNTIITKEYSQEWKPGLEPYYPINDDKNTKLFNSYKALASKISNVIFGGRLSEYKYYDMHQIIGAALSAIKKEFESSK